MSADGGRGVLPAPLRESGAEVAERTRAAWGHRAPDLVLSGARVLLGSGEFVRRDVAVVGQRIVAVAEELSAPGEEVIDLSGKVLVPGYFEPHTHTLGPLSIGSYCSQALVHGTTGVMSDDSFLYGFMPPERYGEIFELSQRLPLVLRWSLRLEPPRRVPLSTIATLIDRTVIGQIGEVMTRPVLDDPPAEVADLIAAARSRGLRVEGHSPGASARTLGVAAAAGITADHEGRRGEDVIERLRAGLWAFIRYTDMLRDAPAIIATLLESGVSLERTGFTTDWSLPPWIAHRGIIDAVIDVALEAGMPAEQAYACASQRPATYLGLDAHFGLVAPGRLASVNVLHDTAEPRPHRVFSLGREVARDGELLVEVPDIDWEAAGAPPWSERAAGPVASTYRRHDDDPAIALEEAAVVHEGRGSGGGAPIACVALDTVTGTFTRAAIYGLPERLEGIASTLTPRRLLVAAGADPKAVERCVDAVIAAGGGIAYQHQGELRELPLPVGGVLTVAPFETVLSYWEETERHFRSLGHEMPDPLSTLLYIASDSLPGARFTAQGLLETRSGRLIEPSRKAEWK